MTWMMRPSVRCQVSSSGRAGAVAGQHLGFPVAVAEDGRKDADLTQAVEDGAVARARRQPIGVERPELGEGGVVENEILIAIEERDGGLDAVKRPVVGGDLAIELALRGLDVGDVDGGAGRHAIDGEHDDVVRLSFAAGDEMHAGLVALSGGDRLGDGFPLAAFEQLDLASRTSSSVLASTAAT